MKNTAEKKCSGCKETKLLTDFYKASRQKDGKDIYCKTCRNKHTKAQLPNRRLKYKHNDEFREKRLAKEKIYRKARKEREVKTVWLRSRAFTSF